MIYYAQKGDFSIALTGDTMISRRLRPFDEPAYLAIRDILQSTDVAFTNMEATIRNPDEGVHDQSPGTLMTMPPPLLDDLKWMGIGMVSCANNHAADFGHEGILATNRHLDNAGIVHSGTGANLDEARAPGYFDSRAGRVALISTNAFFSPHHRAAPQGTRMKGRPGINPLGYSSTYTVDGPAFEQLRNMSKALGFEQEAARRKRHFFAASEIGGGGSNEKMLFLNNHFIRGDGFSIATSANKADLEGNLKWIREARRQSDWVVVSLHCHAFSPRDLQDAQTSAEGKELADFARQFCHAAIEAGADAVACHGPHVSLGLEIYNGKPVFYSLGNFFFQNDTIETVPQESFQRFGLGAEATPADFLDARTDSENKGFPAHPEFWRSIFGVCRFRNWALEAVEVYPLDLGFRLPRSQRGRPVIASGVMAEEILARTQALSSYYGTKLDIRDGVGYVQLQAGRGTTSFQL